MRQSIEKHRPWSVALGGACLLGLGLTSCAKNGVDLTKDDTPGQTAITDRANESILRSKKDLLAADSPKPKPKSKSAATTPDPTDERPALASRWSAPFKSVGNVFRRKPAESMEDPFLANKDADKSSKDSIAALAEEKAKAVKTTQPAAKGLASTDPKDKASAQPAPSKTASQSALDDFLKSSKPVDIHDRASVASYESDALTRKPGTSTKKPASDLFADAEPAKSGGVLSNDRILASKDSPAKSARPFPAADRLDEPVAKPKSSLRQTAMANDAEPKVHAATGSSKFRQNPLAEETVVAAAAPKPKTKQPKTPEGKEIASLLKQARDAGDAGDYRGALDLALEAKDVATRCHYEFAANEAQPDQFVDWISDKVAEERQLAQGREDRKALATTNRPKSTITTSNVSFSKPSASQIFGDADPAVTEPSFEAEQPVVAATSKDQGKPTAKSTFKQWADGIGTQSAGRSPDWPVLSHGEMAATDEMWKPSYGGAEASWTPAAERKPLQVAMAPESKTSRDHLSSPPSLPPVTTTGGISDSSAGVIRADGPLVTLGRPTDSMPESFQNMLAQSDAPPAVSGRRGPRLAAPPPLSFDEVVERPAVATKGTDKNRIVWYAVLGASLLGLLVAFRRWVYRLRTQS